MLTLSFYARERLADATILSITVGTNLPILSAIHFVYNRLAQQRNCWYY